MKRKTAARAEPTRQTDAKAQKDILSSTPLETPIASPCQQRNILLVGRSRMGKSKFVQMLKDPTNWGGKLQLVADTKEPILEQFIVNHGGVHMSLTIIDTPGLSEIKVDADQQRDDSFILNLIEASAKKHVTYFNAILFFASFNDGLQGETLQAMEVLQKYLGETSADFSMLIVPKTESMTDEMVHDLMSEAFSIQKYGEVFARLRRGFHPTGFIVDESMRVQDPQTVKHSYQRILHRRESVLTELLNSVDCVSLLELQFQIRMQQHVRGLTGGPQCNSCGQNLYANAAFCQVCGARQ